MTSRAQQSVSRSLRGILADLPNGASVADSEQLRDVLSGLEYFLPEVLREIRPEWKNESLDGILPTWVRKSGPEEAELFGLCIVISDQSLTPVYVRLQLAAQGDEVSWLECRLGERRGREFVPAPYVRLDKALHRLDLLGVDQVNWYYKVTFGQRRV